MRQLLALTVAIGFGCLSPQAASAQAYAPG